MQVGDLVRIPAWQLNRVYWSEYRDCGMGFVFEITPYAVHVRWSNGRHVAYKMSRAGCLEVVK